MTPVKGYTSFAYTFQEGADNSNMIKNEYLRTMAGLRYSASGGFAQTALKMAHTWEYYKSKQQRSA